MPLYDPNPQAEEIFNTIMTCDQLSPELLDGLCKSRFMFQELHEFKNTLLHWALINHLDNELIPKLSELQKNLSEQEKERFKKEFLDVQDDFSNSHNTPFMLAIKQRKFGVARQLIELGSNISTESYGMGVVATPLGILALWIGTSEAYNNDALALAQTLLDEALKRQLPIGREVLSYPNKVPDANIPYLQNVKAGDRKRFSFAELIQTPDLLQDEGYFMVLFHAYTQLPHRMMNKEEFGSIDQNTVLMVQNPPLFPSSLWTAICELIRYYGFETYEQIKDLFQNRQHSPLAHLGSSQTHSIEENPLIGQYKRLLDTALEFPGFEPEATPPTPQPLWTENPRNQPRLSQSYQQELDVQPNVDRRRCCAIQ